MTTTISGFYDSILQQVMILERCKKEVGDRLLLIRDTRRRRSILYSFLSLDLEKHQLMEQAAVVAARSNEGAAIRRFTGFYSYAESNTDLVRCIRDEMRTASSHMKILQKSMLHPDQLSFAERRLVQEIDKYVTAQARLYKKMKK